VSTFLDTTLWKQLVCKPDSSDFTSGQTAGKILRREDIRALLERLKAGSPNEQYAALGMFLHAAREKNDALGQFSMELLALASALAEKWKFNASGRSADIAQRGYSMLAEMDKGKAAQFLMSHFSYDSLSVHDRERVIHFLAELCHVSKTVQRHNPTAMAQLVEIAKQGKPGAEYAADLLVARQLMRRSQIQKLTTGWRKPGPPDRLRRAAVKTFIALSPQFAGREDELKIKAREWLKTKSIRALNRLYFDFLGKLPEGVPVQPILGLLGKPARQDRYEKPTTYVFSSGEGPELQLHATTNQRLTGFKLK
jgi:hypothetical protein